jgi:hypothetical protein
MPCLFSDVDHSYADACDSTMPWSEPTWPLQVVKATEEGVSRILGRENSVSAAADMDMYVVERRLADDTPRATLADKLVDVALTAA